MCHKPRATGELRCLAKYEENVKRRNVVANHVFATSKVGNVFPWKSRYSTTLLIISRRITSTLPGRHDSEMRGVFPEFPVVPVSPSLPLPTSVVSFTTASHFCSACHLYYRFLLLLSPSVPRPTSVVPVSPLLLFPTSVVSFTTASHFCSTCLLYYCFPLLLSPLPPRLTSVVPVTFTIVSYSCCLLHYRVPLL
jgi:hypothetical protein